jgi:hypothetical protein
MNFDDYMDELKKDTIVNELNLKEKALALPALKAKWVSRLIYHKNSINDLEKNKSKLIRSIVPKVRESMPVKLSDNVIKNTAENTREVQDINNQIDEHKRVVDFLEKIEKVMSSMSFDISNIVKVMQLETL